MKEARHGLDDLRRFAARLAEASGVTPPRAVAWASQLLWYDAAGVPAAGLACLPGWLGRIERGEVDARAEGRFGVERAATAVLDGGGGIPPLVLARAAGVAAEKARDVGVGLVRVTNLGAAGPAAAVAAEVAVGPTVVVLLGPDRSFAAAVPAAGGGPRVVDSTLSNGTKKASATPIEFLSPLLAALTPPGGWLVAAISATAMEPLAALHGRMDAAGDGGLARAESADGRIGLKAEAWNELTRMADRLGVDVPAPVAG